MFRVLTVEDVGDAFEQSLDADQNGGVFVVFPDVPIIRYPELNQIFIFPMIAYAKILSICCPKWKHVNGIFVLPFLFAFIYLILYIMFYIVF